MWPGPRERGGERWIEKEARAQRGGHRIESVSGGDKAQLMMKQGRVGERPHSAFSSAAPRRDVRMSKASRKRLAGDRGKTPFE